MATPELADHPIEELTAEFSRLALKKGLAPDDFFRRFLSASLPIVESQGAIVWGLSPQGELARICDQGDCGQTKSKNPFSHRHLEQLYEVLGSGKSRFLSVRFDRVDWTPKNAVALLLASLLLNDTCVGVVEYQFAEPISPMAESEKTSLLQPLLRQASKYIARQHANWLRDQRPFPHEKLDQFVLALHADDRSRHVALTTVNEGRVLLNCDRLCLATAFGKQAKVLAISGQESILPKSNLVKAICQLAQQVLASGRQIHFEGSLDGFAPQVEESIVNYLRESGAQAFLAIPLWATEAESQEEDVATRQEAKPFAALIIEQLSEATPVLDLKLVDKFASHVSQALFHALEHEKVLLLPVRRSLGRLLNRSERSARKKLAWIAGAATLILACLMFVPFPYQVQTSGKILPVEQSRNYAPHDGEVVEVFVQGGQLVTAGQPLVRLHTDELSMRLLLIKNQLSEKRQVLTALEIERDQTGPASRDDQIRLQGRISKTLVEVQGLESRLAAIEREAALLTVNSPITGKVTTFEPEKLLIGRPVRRGQLLLEVMNENGLWQLELEIPAHKLGHIQSAQQLRQSDELPLKFVLATMPENNFAGQIQTLSTRILEKPDGSRVVQATATITAEHVAGQTACAEVLARIDCGQKSLGYVLFGDLIDAARNWIW